MSVARPATKLLPALLVAACATVPVSTMWKMRNFDLATTDIRKLRAAVRTPNFVHIGADKTKLKMTLTDEQGTLHASQQFALVRVTSAREKQELRRFAKPGFHIQAFRISPKDYERIEMFRLQHSLLKTRFGKQLHGSMRVWASGCELSGHSGESLTVSTYLKSVETGGYVRLTGDIDLRKYSKIKRIDLCPSSSK